MNTLRLKKNEERRLRAGHLWVFSNEVDTKSTPFSAFEPGEPVVVEDFRGKAIGVGLVNPNSLICCRILSRKTEIRPNRSFFTGRIRRSLSLRRAHFDEAHYRLIHGEGDFLPGLIIDRFDDTLAIQANTAGMDRYLPAILEAVDEVLRPQTILLRNDSAARELEGLPRETKTLMGEAPESVEVREGGLTLLAPFVSGQKTGYYYDMRRVRMDAGTLAGRLGTTMVDCFCYVGAMGVRAAKHGARHVTLIDGSATALEYARMNAERNGVADKIQCIRGDAFKSLAELDDNAFGVVSIDPPAFIKRKKDGKKGAQAYRKLNQQAAALVQDGGYLVTASCSQHFPGDNLKRAASSGARAVGFRSQIVWRGGQDVDHPVHPAMPETEYLKAFCLNLHRGGR